MLRSVAILAVLFGFAPWAFAQTAAPADREGVSVTGEAPQAAVAIQYRDIIVEDEEIEVRVQERGDDILIDATPIFEVLKGRVELDQALLRYRRFQDGAQLSIDFTDGKVRANGVVLGALPGFETAEAATTWLSVNAISVLTGTIAAPDPNGGWRFTLDDRLRPKFDLDLFVSGRRVDTTGNEPRTIGSVLLVPLEPIVEAFGHTIVRDLTSVTVTRAQDSTVISLDFSSGLVTVNDTPRGVTPNIAFADTELLLLPFSAIETLTGSHVRLEPGSNRIDVTLDERLGGGVLPGERVDDEAEATPFTPESLDFDIGDRGRNSLGFNSRWGRFNTRLNFETAGGIEALENFQPGLVSLDIQSLDGWIATIGDSNSQFRELSGVDETRIRGVAWRQQRPSGAVLAIAAGLPLTGARELRGGGSAPEFGGFAGGARLIKPDGATEYGVSASVSEDGSSKRAVASVLKDFVRNPDGAGLESVFVAADAGIFNDPTGTGVDLRARVDARYQLSEQSAVQASIAYDGARFNTPSDAFVGLDDDELITLPDPDAPTPTPTVPSFEGDLGDNIGALVAGSLSVDWRAVEDWGAIRNFATGARINYTRQGGASSSETLSATSTANARLGGVGVDLNIAGSVAEATEAGVTERSATLDVRALRRFDWGVAQANYSLTTLANGETDQRFVANVSTRPFTKRLGQTATVSVAPSASALVAAGSTSFRAGLTAAADSGRTFGDRFSVRSQVSALQSVDADDLGTDFFASLTAQYALTRDISLEAGYFDDFADRRDFTLSLRGRVTFNEPRRHTAPRDGRGVLTGRVFFDRNRDGVRQDDEPGVGGVGVVVRRSRLALRADRDGGFTIQNMRTGLYDLGVDRRSLPLGLLVPETFVPRVTIGENRITRIDIPLIASGQIRGAVFIDDNGDGEPTRGEQRLEGAALTLQSVDDGSPPIRLQAAAFGQYGFENLAPGAYVLRVAAAGEIHEFPIELAEDDLFATIHIPIPSDNPNFEAGEELVADPPDVDDIEILTPGLTAAP